MNVMLFWEQIRTFQDAAATRRAQIEMERPGKSRESVYVKQLEPTGLKHVQLQTPLEKLLAGTGTQRVIRVMLCRGFFLFHLSTITGPFPIFFFAGVHESTVASSKNTAWLWNEENNKFGTPSSIVATPSHHDASFPKQTPAICCCGAGSKGRNKCDVLRGIIWECIQTYLDANKFS